MYQNMTREEMIQRLYEGNFTTGELERQLIAKLFEQCCGGGGSSGGETFVVGIESVGDQRKFNKMAKEVFDACKTSNVIFMETEDSGFTTTVVYNLISAMQMADVYTFILGDPFQADVHTTYSCTGDNDYPTYSNK